MTPFRPAKVALEWSKLLGFDQIRRPDDDSEILRLKDARMAKIGSKGCTPPP